MQLLQQYLTFFFLLTPFFVLSVFISMTEESDMKTRHSLAVRIALGASCVCITIFFGGAWLMKLFGITVDPAVLGEDSVEQQRHKTSAELLRDAVVPLAVPITAGPATLGTLIVMGLEKNAWNEKLATAAAMVLACWTIGLMLFFSGVIVRVLGRTIIAMLGKITGLILSAIAVSMIITGVHALWTAAA